MLCAQLLLRHSPAGKAAGRLHITVSPRIQSIHELPRKAKLELLRIPHVHKCPQQADVGGHEHLGFVEYLQPTMHNAPL